MQSIRLVQSIKCRGSKCHLQEASSFHPHRSPFLPQLSSHCWASQGVLVILWLSSSPRVGSTQPSEFAYPISLRLDKFVLEFGSLDLGSSTIFIMFSFKKKKISFSLFSMVKIITFLCFLSISMLSVQASPSPWQIRGPKCLTGSQYHYQIKQRTAHLWVPISVIVQLSKSEQNSYQFTKVNLGPNNIHLGVKILGCGPILQNTSRHDNIIRYVGKIRHR